MCQRNRLAIAAVFFSLDQVQMMNSIRLNDINGPVHDKDKYGPHTWEKQIEEWFRVKQVQCHPALSHSDSGSIFVVNVATEATVLMRLTERLEESTWRLTTNALTVFYWAAQATAIIVDEVCKHAMVTRHQTYTPRHDIPTLAALPQLIAHPVSMVMAHRQSNLALHERPLKEPPYKPS